MRYIVVTDAGDVWFTHRGNSHASQLMDAFLVWKRPNGLVVVAAMVIVVATLVFRW